MGLFNQPQSQEPFKLDLQTIMNPSGLSNQDLAKYQQTLYGADRQPMKPQIQVPGQPMMNIDAEYQKRLKEQQAFQEQFPALGHFLYNVLGGGLAKMTADLQQKPPFPNTF